MTNLILKTLLLLSIYNTALNAKGIAPSFELDLDLKKDETVCAHVSSAKDSKSPSSELKDFRIRWTLYRNEGLVVLVRYDKFPYQFMLYKDYKLNSWTLNLLNPQGVNTSPSQPTLKVYFSGIDDPFNDEKTVVHLRLYGFGEVSFQRSSC